MKKLLLTFSGLVFKWKIQDVNKFKVDKMIDKLYKPVLR
jgi:hypothetical protein